MLTYDLKLDKYEDYEFEVLEEEFIGDVYKKDQKIQTVENFIFQKSPEFQNLEQKFDILMNKFEYQINVNNYILQNLGENHEYISKIDQKLNFLNIKTDQNSSQNIFVKNENLQIFPTSNQHYI